MNTSFPQELKRLKPKIWRVLSSYLPKNPHKFAKIVADYPNRQSQYLRPGLLLLTYQILGKQDSKAMLSAVALQVSHEWLLVHDDVEDGAEMRRGKPSLNKIHGNALAVNTGDSLHLIMWRMLLDNFKILGPILGQKVSYKIQDMLFTATLGQFQELDWIQRKTFNISLRDYFQMIDKKTGYYTITGPIQLGAILAGQEKILLAIKAFGTPWGRAFQIQNDIMNIKNIKPGATSDITEGKRSLLFIHTFSQSTLKERGEIRKIYCKNPEEKTADEIEFILWLIKKYDSLGYAETIAQKMVKQTHSKLKMPEVKCLTPLIAPILGSKDAALPLTL